jgi:hypothetical protein
MNRINLILASRGVESIRPSKAVLEKLQIKFNTWNMWVANEKDPQLFQLPIVADFLNVKVKDLLVMEPEVYGDNPESDS